MPSHYSGLKFLCEQHNVKLVFREFSIVSRLIKAIFKLQFANLAKIGTNAFFLMQLLFSRNKKVVLGIAPYDYKLLFLRLFLIGHQIYYHTSWPVWDGSHYPKKKLVNDFVLRRWRQFLCHDVRHIFAVTNATKNGLIANYGISPKKFSVVYHSYDATIYGSGKPRKRETLRFLFIGRLVEEKGLVPLLQFFSEQSGCSLSIIGDGKLQNLVKEYTTRYDTIDYLGFLSSKQRIATYLQSADYLLLNSKRTNTWQELFGMVIIEAMACGCIPLATDHIGPLELIENGKNGILVTEDDFLNTLNGLINTKPNGQMVEQAIYSAKKYTVSAIALHWEAIFTN